MTEIKYDTKECPLYIGNTCHALDKAYRVGRADAIDEFCKYIDKHSHISADGCEICLDDDITILAEQIKEQKDE